MGFDERGRMSVIHNSNTQHRPVEGSESGSVRAHEVRQSSRTAAATPRVPITSRSGTPLVLAKAVRVQLQHAGNLQVFGPTVPPIQQYLSAVKDTCTSAILVPPLVQDWEDLERPSRHLDRSRRKCSCSLRRICHRTGIRCNFLEV